MTRRSPAVLAIALAVEQALGYSPRSDLSAFL